ncbi:hypothetical protein MHB40_14720 [Lysinibacillus sp. FSL K6-0057]|uniref:hypothetical protein n=1 Tax=Lysinibacillus sp. FSL K6-0057 TaxID=2921411 RepID=UPI003159C1A1
MNKFEYGVLKERYEFGQHLYSFDGEIINEKGYKGDYYYEIRFIDALNILGKDSWELTMKDGNEYIMKREIN